MTFGQRLRFLREQRGLKQIELAEKIGLRNHTISNYERGERAPSPESLEALANFFGVTTDYLLYGKKGTRPYLDDFLANNEEIFFHGIKLDDRDIQKIIFELEFLVSMKQQVPKQGA